MLKFKLRRGHCRRAAAKVCRPFSPVRGRTDGRTDRSMDGMDGWVGWFAAVQRHVLVPEHEHKHMQPAINHVLACVVVLDDRAQA